MSEQTIQLVPLKLTEVESDLLGDELDGLIRALPPDRAQPYLALDQSVQARAIPSSQYALLASVLELILGSGRVRHDHRAEGERILQGVYKRTARGQAADANLAQVNKALAVLNGQPLKKLEVTSRVPGNYSLSITTDTLQILVKLDPRGIQIEKTTV